MQYVGNILLSKTRASHFIEEVSRVIVNKKKSPSSTFSIIDDFPKPRITTHPKTSVALRGNNTTLSCVASSSSDSPMTTAWRKDGELLYDAEVENYARYQDGQLIYTTMLHLLNVNFTDEGLYQCVVSNHFGSNYSNRAKLTINGESPFHYFKNILNVCRRLLCSLVSFSRKKCCI